jgi:hypothetical protein
MLDLPSHRTKRKENINNERDKKTKRQKDKKTKRQKDKKTKRQEDKIDFSFFSQKDALPEAVTRKKKFLFQSFLLILFRVNPFSG